MTLEWRVSDEFVPYPQALAEMEARAAAIRDAHAPEMVWLLEHPPLYTAGTSARPTDLLAPGNLPVFETGRGGQYTYHGPGQRIAYVLLDLKDRGADIRCYVHDLEEWIIRALACFNVRGERRPGRVGIWVAGAGREDKIAAIGVRVRRWVSYHGIAINLDPDLSRYAGIVPCGIQETAATPYGVTSLHRLGVTASMPELDMALAATFKEIFGKVGKRAPCAILPGAKPSAFAGNRQG